MSYRTLSATTFAAAAALLASATSFAAGPTSGQIIIRGTVGALCEIGVVDFNTTLDLVTGESDTAVGEVRETCNNPNGYSITLSSANGSQMNGPLDRFSAYTVNYDALSNSSLSSDQSLARPEPQWNVVDALRVNVQGQAELPAGSYTDVVTITIAAA